MPMTVNATTKDYIPNLKREEIKHMIKLANKRMALAYWATGYWVYVKDTNPNEAENCGAGWFRMNDDGEIVDEKGTKYVSEDFSENMDEYFALEPGEERKD